MSKLLRLPVKPETNLLMQLIDGKTGKKCEAFVQSPRGLIELFNNDDFPKELDLATTYVDVLSNVDQVMELSDEEKKEAPITDMIMSFPLFSAASFRDFFKEEDKSDEEKLQSAQ